MPQTPILTTKNKLARFYGVGILAFTAVVGSITLVVKFVGLVQAA